MLAAYTTGLVLLQQRPRESGGLQGGGALLHKGCFSILHRQFVTLGVYEHLTEVAGIDLEVRAEARSYHTRGRPRVTYIQGMGRGR